MSRAQSSIQSIAVIGAGIIGLSCALELADRGIQVSLFEKQWPPRGASWAAAGMLAPAFEAAATPGVHPDLFELCDTSASMWPDWAARLEVRSGRSSGFVAGPSLAIATTSEQAAELNAVRAQLVDHPQAPEDCLHRLDRIEPSIAAEVKAAILLPSDGQADNRATLQALIASAQSHPNISLLTQEATLRMTPNGLDHAGHDATLITSGWQSAKVSFERVGQSVIATALDPLFDRITAFGGQMLSVAPVENGPRRTVRCGHIYIVPKSDRVIIGATTEPGRELTQTEPDAIAALLRRAVEICPALANASVLESWAGIRPGTKDHAPILGETTIENLFVATGHYRNGILLAPLTAKIMGDLIANEESSDLARAFSPQARFAEQM
nr:FAD-dependent oxidoreductase [Hyphomonas sp. Mor2]